MKITKLIDWSKSEYKALPWRVDRTLYKTLVSEIMLQQTTVGTVKNHFNRFIETFPNIEVLASASEQQMLVAWKGLGYYRRARNLKKIAETIVREYEGEFPKDIQALQKIPGIGPYTSNALVGIGMDQRALAVDANLERVIARVFGIKAEKGPKLQKEITRLFNLGEIFTKVNSYRDLNEALMDLGRTFCQARKATCELCPLKENCSAFSEGKPSAYPIEKKLKTKASQEHELNLLRVYIMKKDKILVYKKDKNEWLSGQYEVPTFILKTTDDKLVQYPVLKNKNAPTDFYFKTSITKYKIQNNVLLAEESFLKKNGFNKKVEWRSITSVDSNLSTATTKGLKKIWEKNRDQE